MTKEQEAMRLALDALEICSGCIDGYYIPLGKSMLPEVEKATTALEEALADNSEDKINMVTEQDEIIKELEFLSDKQLYEIRDALKKVLADHSDDEPISQVPSGWKLVPVELFRKLFFVIEKIYFENGLSLPSPYFTRELYEAMLNAAPQPPKEEV
tara:strand:- start:8112 stop:8579 length:468 start_codon:yes stop_codon:yes gene_type:complete